jgi:RimJ/RimL family protein N-acetyltransferase
LLNEFRTPSWRDRVPEGYRLAPVDRRLLGRTDLKNHAQVADWVAGWHSTDDFMQNGFGFCLVCDGAAEIASWCIADTVLGERCEIGVTTDVGHRRRGLAATVVGAAVEYCVKHRFTEIGWHCLASNAGSIAVATKVGFELERAYDGYSAYLPAENPADLTPAEYRDWALHYARVTGEGLGYSFHAAEAWAMAGEPERALDYLRRLPERGWRGRLEWVEHNWRFASLREEPAFRQVLASLRHTCQAG